MTFIDMALDPFKGKVSSKQSDLVSRIESESPELQEALRMFEEDKDKSSKFGFPLEKLAILNPNQIDLVLQTLITSKSSDPDKHRLALVSYVNGLIQRSYDQSYNGFILSTGDFNPFMALKEITGTKDRLMKIHIHGNGGDYLGDLSRYLDVTVLGNVGRDSPHRAKNSIFRIEGDSDMSMGYGTWDSKIVVQGKVGDYFAQYSQRTTFEFMNGCGFMWFQDNKKNSDMPKDCGFIAHDAKTYSHIFATLGYKGMWKYRNKVERAR